MVPSADRLRERASAAVDTPEAADGGVQALLSPLHGGPAPGGQHLDIGYVEHGGDFGDVGRGSGACDGGYSTTFRLGPDNDPDPRRAGIATEMRGPPVDDSSVDITVLVKAFR